MIYNSNKYGVLNIPLLKDFIRPLFHILFAVYDGNGNVSALVNASNGEVSANYEYGPYGEPIRVSGVISRENPYRFSTKRTVDSIDIILYEYRAYSPSLGRWLSRDLIGENGGVNLYGFVGGDAIDNFDAFGLWWSGPSFLSDHSKMTETSFNSAIAQFSLLTTQCRQNMLKILKRLTTNRILGLIPNN